MWYGDASEQNTGTTYTYSPEGFLVEITDYDNARRYRYTYDTEGRVERVIFDTVTLGADGTVISSGMTYEEGYVYNKEGQHVTTGFIYHDYLGVRRNAKLYEYNEAGELTGWRYLLYADTVSYTYTPSGALQSQTIDLGAVCDATGGLTNYTRSYTYLTPQSPNAGNTSSRVESFTEQIGNRTDTYRYRYYSEGNIDVEYHNGEVARFYSYDEFGQLVVVDDWENDIQYLYTYDKAGNLTQCEITETVEYETQALHFGYASGAWGDQLTNYNGTSISYDAVGNPLNWRGGMSFTWQNGRELASVTKGGQTYSYVLGEFFSIGIVFGDVFIWSKSCRKNKK